MISYHIVSCCIVEHNFEDVCMLLSCQAFIHYTISYNVISDQYVPCCIISSIYTTTYHFVLYYTTVGGFITSSVMVCYSTTVHVII